MLVILYKIELLKKRVMKTPFIYLNINQIFNHNCTANINCLHTLQCGTKDLKLLKLLISQRATIVR